MVRWLSLGHHNKCLMNTNQVIWISLTGIVIPGIYNINKFYFMSVLKEMTNEISLTSKICLGISILIMLLFFGVQSCIVFGYCKPTIELSYFGYGCILLFMPLFGIVIHEFIGKKANVEEELVNKNTYLEHAAKILRHDMHSGINVYMPRGISSLERRLSDQQIKDLKIGPPLRMIKEGLVHTQKVYKGVYEFTNLVKKNSILQKESHDIKEILNDYLKTTSYKSQVSLSDNLPTIKVNDSLFCTAIDNLVRNGLKYNDSESKLIKIYSEGRYIVVEDNGRGLTPEEFKQMSKPYTRKDNQKEQGSGLGLNICKSIIEEHGFKIIVETLNRGMSEFYEELHKAEKFAENAPNTYVFNKESLEKSASEDNFSGKLITRRGGRDQNKIYVSYKENNKTPLIRGTKIKIKI